MVWFTASNALERSIDAATVRRGGSGVVDASGDVVNYWEECCGGGSIGTETVLGVGEGDGVELGE